MLDPQQAVALLPLADPDAATLLASVSEDKRELSWWIILRDGTPIAGDAGGGVALLAELPGLRVFGHLLKAFQLSLVVDALDKLVAHHRGRLSHIIPDVTVPRRYP